MNLINREQICSIFGLRMGNSVILTMMRNKIDSTTKSTYITSTRFGKEVKMYHQMVYYNLDDMIRFYSKREDKRYIRMYTERYNLLKEFRDGN